MTTPKDEAFTAGPKLTGPQQSLLNEISRHPLSCHSSYKPAVKLVALGLAEWIASTRVYNKPLRITDLGRAALLQATGGSNADPR